MRRFAPALTLGLLLLASPALAQDDWKKMIERGEYEALAEKLRPFLPTDKADAKLKKYIEMNLEFLARGAKARNPGQEIILFRGAKNDRAFRMPASSGGDALMLPNSIRYMRKAYDARLPRLDGYFREATTLMGGNGDQLRELDRIIEHHKGGGLGTNANSTKSVLISASTRPIQHFGPPYYILKVAPERAIFNHKGLTGEYEVLLPFFVLPTEIVAKVETYQELINHPLYQQSKYKDLQVRSYGYGAGGSGNTWEVIENNIRNGRNPLEGVAGLNSYFQGEGTQVGPRSSARDVERFVEKVGRHGGVVEFVSANDPRLPKNAQARTYMLDGQPKVLLREGRAVPKFALLDELTHVIQLERMLKTHAPAEVETLLLRAHMGDPQARDVVNRWEIRAKRLIRGMLASGDPNREVLTRSIAQLERELDPYAGKRRVNGTIDWKQVTRQVGGGLAHFTLALFLKELAMVAETGDRRLIEEFFDGLMKTDFYVHYGLFTVGATGADLAYGAYLQKHVARFIRPQFVQTVLRSTVSLAVGMALPDLLMGRFEGRTFALNLAGLGLSSTLVRSGIEGLKWVTNLDRSQRGMRILAGIKRHARLAKAGGFLYHTVTTAVVLYFGDKIARGIDSALTEREARRKVREATAAVLADPKGPGVRQALEDLALAHREWRDLLARPVQEAEATLFRRLQEVGREVRTGDIAVERYRKMLEENPDRFANLRESVERIEARREAEFRSQVEALMADHDRRLESKAREVYGASAPVSAPGGEEATWILRGSVPGERGDPYAARTDWWASLMGRSNPVLDWSDDLPDTRLASYDHEAALYDALAAAHSDDPMAAAEYERRADDLRAIRDQDQALVLGTGPGMQQGEEVPSSAESVVRGFLDTLEELEQE